MGATCSRNTSNVYEKPDMHVKTPPGVISPEEGDAKDVAGLVAEAVRRSNSLRSDKDRDSMLVNLVQEVVSGLVADAIARCPGIKIECGSPLPHREVSAALAARLSAKNLALASFERQERAEANYAAVLSARRAPKTHERLAKAAVKRTQAEIELKKKVDARNAAAAVKHVQAVEAKQAAAKALNDRVSAAAARRSEQAARAEKNARRPSLLVKLAGFVSRRSTSIPGPDEHTCFTPRNSLVHEAPPSQRDEPPAAARVSLEVVDIPYGGPLCGSAAFVRVKLRPAQADAPPQLAKEESRSRADTPVPPPSPLPSPRGRDSPRGDSPQLAGVAEASTEDVADEKSEKASALSWSGGPRDDHALTTEQESAKALGATVVGPCSVWTPRSGKGSSKKGPKEAVAAPRDAASQGDDAAREAAALIVSEMLEKVSNELAAEAEPEAPTPAPKKRWWRRK